MNPERQAVIDSLEARVRTLDKRREVLHACLQKLTCERVKLAGVLAYHRRRGKEPLYYQTKRRRETLPAPGSAP